MSGQFKDKPFKQRFAKMGDLAEGVFKKWAATNDVSYVEYGMSRPPFDHFMRLSPFIRYTPDFLCEAQGKTFRHLIDERGKPTRHFLVEIKGCGRDQLVKLKIDNIQELLRWQAVCGRPVILFVYDSANKAVSNNLTIDRLHEMAPELEVGHFHDGGPPKPYYNLPARVLEWEPFGETH
jgi:hypothetical protein